MSGSLADVGLFLNLRDRSNMHSCSHLQQFLLLFSCAFRASYLSV